MTAKWSNLDLYLLLRHNFYKSDVFTSLTKLIEQSPEQKCNHTWDKGMAVRPSVGGNELVKFSEVQISCNRRCTGTVAHPTIEDHFSNMLLAWAVVLNRSSAKILKLMFLIENAIPQTPFSKRKIGKHWSVASTVKQKYRNLYCWCWHSKVRFWYDA